MSILSRICASAILCCLIAFSFLPIAYAGQLFPPADLAASGTPNVVCPSGKVLGWTGQSVACTDPTLGVTTTNNCTGGMEMVGLSGGVPICANPTPAVTTTANCTGGKLMVGLSGGAPVCADPTPGVTTSSCPTGQLMTGIISGNPTCIAPPTPAQCGAGQALTYTASGFQCVAVDQQTIPTCQGGQYLSFNGTSFSCNATATISVGCPSGQVLTAIINGLPVCTTPATVSVSCPNGQVLTGISNGQPVCAVESQNNQGCAPPVGTGTANFYGQPYSINNQAFQVYDNSGAFGSSIGPLSTTPSGMSAYGLISYIDGYNQSVSWGYFGLCSNGTWINSNFALLTLIPQGAWIPEGDDYEVFGSLRILNSTGGDIPVHIYQWGAGGA